MSSACNRELLAKAMSELSFEGMLAPVQIGNSSYEMRFPDAVYYFDAGRTAFGGWRVDPGTITRSAVGILGDEVATSVTDVRQFLIDAAFTIGIDAPTLAHYIDEVTATLTADEAMVATARPAAELALLDHRVLDGHLRGHPWLVANKGRVGFSASDQQRYSPEARRPFQLSWLAVQRGLAEFRGTPELSEQAVVDHELPAEVVARFTGRLREAGVDPRAYVWMPVHPWQLDHVVRTLWAPEIVAKRIVELGPSDDHYLATQSIRTMSNETEPHRYQVKLPLRILNTAVWRGIPPHCSLSAPMVTQWLAGIWRHDEHLVRWQTVLLGEVASVTVRHPHLTQVDGAPYMWLETLGCIWREPLDLVLQPGERCWPLAAVLHVDHDGDPLVSEYIGENDVRAWFAALLRVLVRPLLHVLYTYGITVNPHGENVHIITDSGGVPSRAVLKDLVDDVNVSADPVAERGPEPDMQDRILPRKPWHVLRQYLVDALFVGVLRPLEPVLVEHHGIGSDEFWGMLKGEIEAYRHRFSHLAARIDAGNLLVPEFPRYPLNGDRLLQTGYVELAYRHAIKPDGVIPNPMFPVRAVETDDGW